MTRTWPTGGPTGCSGVVDMAAEATDRTRHRRPAASPVLDGAAAEGGGGRALLTVAEVADLDGVTGVGGGHGGPHVGAAPHRLAVDGDDEVARPEPGRFGPAARLDLRHQGPVAVGSEVLPHLRVDAVEVEGGHAEEGHGPTADVLDQRAHGVDGDGEADVLRPRGDGR